MGDYFSDTIYGEIESLALYAGIHNKHFGFHRVLSRRFPYSIYYDIEDGEARVYGVLDNRRNPTWIYNHLQVARTSESLNWNEMSESRKEEIACILNAR